MAQEAKIDFPQEDWHGGAKLGTGSPMGKDSPMEKSPKFIPTC
jgi:hypothetical protein